MSTVNIALKGAIYWIDPKVKMFGVMVAVALGLIPNEYSEQLKAVI